jgi:hypothetical protein
MTYAFPLIVYGPLPLGLYPPGRAPSAESRRAMVAASLYFTTTGRSRKAHRPAGLQPPRVQKRTARFALESARKAQPYRLLCTAQPTSFARSFLATENAARLPHRSDNGIWSASLLIAGGLPADRSAGRVVHDRNVAPTREFLMKRIAAISLLLTLFAVGAANAEPVLFSAVLTGPAEDPPNSSPGLGGALVGYDSTSQTLGLLASFAFLTSPNIAAHIHCCVDPNGTAGVATAVPTFPRVSERHDIRALLQHFGPH